MFLLGVLFVSKLYENNRRTIKELSVCHITKMVDVKNLHKKTNIFPVHSLKNTIHSTALFFPHYCHLVNLNFITE